jgi:hypothetical protein
MPFDFQDTLHFQSLMSFQPILKYGMDGTMADFSPVLALLLSVHTASLLNAFDGNLLLSCVYCLWVLIFEKASGPFNLYVENAKVAKV